MHLVVLMWFDDLLFMTRTHMRRGITQHKDGLMQVCLLVYIFLGVIDKDSKMNSTFLSYV